MTDKIVEDYFRRIADDVDSMRRDVASVKEQLFEVRADVATQKTMTDRLDKALDTLLELDKWRSGAEPRLKRLEKERDEQATAVRKMFWSVLGSLLLAAIMGAVALWTQSNSS